MSELWHWFPYLPLNQFQLLFKYLFNVICIFTSRYLCTIGIPPVFIFRQNLSPDLSINPKILYSLRVHARAQRFQTRTGVSPLSLPFRKELSLDRGQQHLYRPQFGSPARQVTHIHILIASRFTCRP